MIPILYILVLGASMWWGVNCSENNRSVGWVIVGGIVLGLIFTLLCKVLTT